MLTVHFGDFNDGYVEGAAAQVIYGEPGVSLFLVHAVGQRRGCGFVDDAPHLQSRDLACVLGRLALRIVEICRHGNDRLGYFLTQVILRRLPHFHEHARGDLRGRHLFAFYINPGIAVVRLDDFIGHHADILLHYVVFVAPAD